METKLISLSMDPDNSTDALVIVTTTGVIRLSKTERDSDLTADAIKTRLRSKVPPELQNEIHTHLNRSGSYAYAIGKEPEVWPEDIEV